MHKAEIEAASVSGSGQAINISCSAAPVRQALSSRTARAVEYIRVATVALFAAAFVFYIIKSLRWPMMIDSPVIHYVNFLMAHGLKPYGQITDMNMPGSYLLDSMEMHVFGPGDLALRIYSYSLAVILTVAMVSITAARDWLAGVYAGTFFVLLQAAEGPKTAVEREQVLVTLMIVGYAFLFVSVRRRQPIIALLFGLTAGMAPTIKPTSGVLPIMLVGLMIMELRRRQIRYAAYVVWAMLGLALALCTSVLFLWTHHAFGDFAFMLRTQMPSYVSMSHPPLRDMSRTLLPVPVLIPLSIACISFAINSRAKTDWNWERTALVLGVFAGLVSYFGQNKGFLHHRYLFLSFLLLWIGLQLTVALRGTGVIRALGIAGIAITVLLILPRYLLLISHGQVKSQYTMQLQRDLSDLGGQQLQHRVLCLDLVFGCLNSLYHLDLVENAGYTGDLLLFQPNETAGVRYYRDDFLRRQRNQPADVLVVSNEWLEHPNTFARLATWPQFQPYLDQYYTLLLSREFPVDLPQAGRSHTNINGDAPAYRIYVRKGVTLPEGTHGHAALLPIFFNGREFSGRGPIGSRVLMSFQDSSVPMSISAAEYNAAKTP